MSLPPSSGKHVSGGARRYRSAILAGFYVGVALFIVHELLSDSSLEEQIRALAISVAAGVFVALAVALLRSWDHNRASSQHEVERRIDLGTSKARPLPKQPRKRSRNARS